jgi:formyl-CoA transferase
MRTRRRAASTTPRLYALLSAETRRASLDAEWLEAFDARRHSRHAGAHPGTTSKDILADPHLAAIGFFTEREHPTEGRITHHGRALSSGREVQAPEYRSHAPSLGQRHASRCCARPGWATRRSRSSRRRRY